MERNNTYRWLFVLIGGILALLINLLIINNMIIPDPCYYHTNETTFEIDLFYSTTSASNGHPEPNLFNILFTLGIGGALGLLVHYRMYSNRND